MMKKSKDELGDRMKQYESLSTSTRLISGIPVYARIDGRSFSKLTRKLERPFCKDFHNSMVHTTRQLMENTNALIGYTQSDEISLVWLWPLHENMLFGGKVSKLNSVLSGMASSIFTKDIFTKDININEDSYPHFDCRVMNLPNEIEAINCLLWREFDARKNAISMAARTVFSQKQLHGKSTKQLVEMMSDADVDFMRYPSCFRKGTYLLSQVREIHPSELMHIPEKHRPVEPVKRASIDILDISSLLDVPDKVKLIFSRTEKN